MKNRIYRYKIIILFLFIILGFILVTYQFWLTQIGKFLIYRTTIEPASAIAVLGGGEEGRVKQGIELLKKKYANKIIFTGEYLCLPSMAEVHWAELAKKQALANGIPSQNIIIELNSKSTHDDALLIKAFAEKYKFKSLIIVTSSYHSKRSYYTFKKVFKASPIKLMFYPLHDDNFKKSRWWESEVTLIQVNNEYVKFIYYLFNGYI